VRGGQEEVTAFANSEGRFNLDVPLLPDQVNQLKVYATGAKGEGLTSAPALAPIQQQTMTPPSTVLVVQITEPSSGATVTADSVLVRGFVDAGGLEVGVSVNSSPAAVVGNTFAALVPVTPETTTLIAVATTVTGAKATQSIGITVGAPSTPSIILRASPAGGVAPLSVGFSVLGGPIASKVELDLDADGTVDFTGASLEGQIFTYAKPGAYTPRVKLTDSGGKQSTASTTVEVYDQVVLDAQLQAKWTGLKDALRAGDVARAATFFHTSTRAAYQSQLGRFNSSTLMTIDRWMTTIQLVRVGPGGAQYEMLREEEGETFSFAVWFQLDEDGIWRLRRF
jgi:PKD repeat protein